MTVVNDRAGIAFVDAMTANEVAMLGDRLIGTRAPLVLSLVADVTKPRAIHADGQVPFTVGTVEMYCGVRRIADDAEKNITFYLM
jgi:hypothetical protein